MTFRLYQLRLLAVPIVLGAGVTNRQRSTRTSPDRIMGNRRTLNTLQRRLARVPCICSLLVLAKCETASNGSLSPHGKGETRLGRTLLVACRRVRFAKATTRVGLEVLSYMRAWARGRRLVPTDGASPSRYFRTIPAMYSASIWAFGLPISNGRPR